MNKCSFKRVLNRGNAVPFSNPGYCMNSSRNDASTPIPKSEDGISESEVFAQPSTQEKGVSGSSTLFSPPVCGPHLFSLSRFASHFWRCMYDLSLQVDVTSLIWTLGVLVSEFIFLNLSTSGISDTSDYHLDIRGANLFKGSAQKERVWSQVS